MSAVRASDELRLKFEKSSPELKVYDMTVVEYFEKNRPYGFEIEAEDATVHIINPQGRAERESHISQCPWAKQEVITWSAMKCLLDLRSFPSRNAM